MTLEAGPEHEPGAALVAGVTTQHFALQSAIANATTEAGARASIYLYSLSGALVAIGFTDRSSPGFLAFVGAVLPAIFVLGLFTVVRLVDISLEHVQARNALARILAWYRGFTRDRELLRALRADREPDGADNPALRFGPLAAGLTTIAAMVATVNAFVAAVGVVLLSQTLGLATVAAWAAGAVTLVALIAAFFRYQGWRLEEAKAAGTGT